MVGPAECQYILRWCIWRKAKFTYDTIVSFLIVGAVGSVAAGTLFIGALILWLPVVILFFGYRRWLSNRNVEAFNAQGESLRTGRPVWLPYGRRQLREIRTKGMSYGWPQAEGSRAAHGCATQERDRGATAV
jgi:hypothetical protein